MIEIKKNPNGDTRTAKKDVTFSEFQKANDMHRQDVQTVMDGGKVTRNNTVDIIEASVKGNITKPIGNPSTTTTPSTLPYHVRILDKSGLNVRRGAGITNPIVACANYNEVYTIIDEVQVGNSKWGLLKSYKNGRNGWINVTEGKYVTKVKVK